MKQQSFDAEAVFACLGELMLNIVKVFLCRVGFGAS
jgi:hypothetical protein